MLKYSINSIFATIWLFLVCSLAYTFFVWAVGRIFFPFQAGGSLFYEGARPAGSLLIGEDFSSPFVFDSRPSSAGKGYYASCSSASNYGPDDKKYVSIVKRRIKAFLLENPSVKKGDVPVDLVTGSGSGLDPFISIAGALAQIPRISSLTGIKTSALKKLVMRSASPRSMGIFGTPGIDTVALNIKLSRMIKKSRPVLYKKVFK